MGKGAFRLGIVPKWTEQEIELLKHGYLNGWPLIEISNLLDRSITSIGSKARQTGFTIKKCYQWSSDREESLKELVKTGLSYSKIAGILGMTKNACIGKAHRMGIWVGPRLPSAESMRATAQARWEKSPLSWRRTKKAQPPKKYTPKPKVRLIVNGNIPSLVPLEHEPIHLVQIKNGQCKFIEGDDRMCCGRETLNGFSWCPHHYVRAHIPDRRFATMAYLYKQPVASSQQTGNTEPTIQTMDRRSPDRAGSTEGEVSFG